ncbi:hypothetical protein [Prosthecobacter sp.]|uniref:hypothetical protein n=1 Tax=Prosthecobacter sp. TaxID=1965333 RepID=UPI003782E5B2
MKLRVTPNYRRSTEMEAEAMINEGGAIRQPSMREADRALAHLRAPGVRPFWVKYLPSPVTVFFASFATSLVVALLINRPHEKA